MSRSRVNNSGAAGTADFLNYAALIDEGLILCKDGSLLAGFFFRGPDQESATPKERNSLSRLGSGFALWVDAVRLPSAAYPEPSASHFPDPVSRAIDEERRRHFLNEGAHFESEHALLGVPEHWTGDTPKLGESFIAAAALDGFPHETFPGILARLDALAIPYRFSTRFIPLDGHEAVLVASLQNAGRLCE
jgi:type IV secretory pathway VirB4 component